MIGAAAVVRLHIDRGFIRLDVIAEGVETLEQVMMLKKLQCKYAQGFYFSKPLAAMEVADLLTDAPVWR